MPKSTGTISTSSPRERIVAYLQSNGGQVDSPDGLGLTADMAAATGYNQVAALNAMLVRLETEGLIKRDVRGKRTYAVSLARRRGGGKTAARSPRKASSARRARTGGSRDIAGQIAALRRDADALARNIRDLENTLTKR